MWRSFSTDRGMPPAKMCFKFCMLPGGRHQLSSGCACAGQCMCLAPLYGGVQHGLQTTN